GRFPDAQRRAGPQRPGAEGAESGKMSLLDLARSIAARADAGEHVEAYVSRSRDTDVKVFGGAGGELSVAESGGVGVRVIVDGRLGYAWAGSLDADVIADVLDDARDNARFSAPDEWNGLPTLDDAHAVDTVDLDLWREDLASIPTTDKVTLALDLERATATRDGRVRGVESAHYGDAAVESAVASSVG